ncbi:preprotein translocase subunit SecY [Shouchella lonarensis]|uniref:Protein translocase subunit SecY n=1 Tax=Shouchella lonarensis TaxID=1464122 RepID=A0A1G6M3Z1_9BACI|nr:preprotein translocase subunit SecY [Shouchella lonarensis]SDC50034.1 protein translocase subunit secY/sec61 alpha [Shouchella lonarensis]
MFKAISNIFRVKDLRRKIIFTLMMLVVFRIGSFIPVPGTNSAALDEMFKGATAFGFLDSFGGGALSNFSIFAMGIMPYITASIVVQLLQLDVVPKFAEWAKQGEAGRKKLTQVTRYGTIVLGFIQAIAMSIGFNTMSSANSTGEPLLLNTNVTTFLTIALVLTAGTAFLMWLGEQITAYGVGNGISLLIFAGIAAGVPGMLKQLYVSQLEGAGDQLFLRVVTVALLALVVLLIIIGVIYVQQALRKIPVQYAKRVANRQTMGGQSTHLPIKVNAAGVIPVIFASALFYFPSTIASFVGQENDIAKWIIANFEPGKWIGGTVFVALIIAFTYFYTFVQVNPEKMAENLQKQGGYIPGIRPGQATQTFITKILYRLTFVGALFLATIATIPVVFIAVMNLPSAVQIGGTGLLIIVGVALDTMKQIEGQLIKRSYKGFMK